MNDDVQSDLYTLTFNNGEQLEYFHSRIIRLQQETNISGETVSSTKFLLQCMKEFTKCAKLNELIVPKMTNIIKFIYKNIRLDSYIKENINGIYCYIEIIGAPNIFNSSGQRYHHFGASYYTKNDTETL